MWTWRQPSEWPNKLEYEPRRETWDRFSFIALRRKQFHQHLDLGLSASLSVQQYLSVKPWRWGYFVLSLEINIILYWEEERREENKKKWEKVELNKEVNIYSTYQFSCHLRKVSTARQTLILQEKKPLRLRPFMKSSSLHHLEFVESRAKLFVTWHILYEE